MKIINIDIKCLQVGKIYIKALVEGDISKLNVGEIVGGQYDLTISKIKHKRTLTANAYYQVLLDQLANKMTIQREELHRFMIERYSVVKIQNDVPLRFAIQKGIDGTTISKYSRLEGTKTMNGKEYNIWQVLKGSSEMDTIEFKHLLDGLIDECQAQGIQTMTPAEIERLKVESG